jgi:hypothetical protein
VDMTELKRTTYDEGDQATRVALKLRLDEALRRRVANAAKASVRSLNSEIVYRLKHSFEEAGGA